MADTFQLTDGTTTIDLIYNASTQRNYKLRDSPRGNRVAGSEPRAIWHQPSDFARELIETVDDTQMAEFTVTVHKDSDVDDMLDAIVKARRLLRQAADYQESGDVDRVTLKVQRDGATNATLWPVIYGWVDDSEAHYNEAGALNSIAYDARLVLHLEPYGERSASIAPRNLLPSSPHFVEDSNADGIADSWTQIGTGSTYSIRDDVWLVGGKSQQVVTDSSGLDGIRSATITCGTSVDVIAYAWIRHASGDRVSTQLYDGNNNLLQEKLIGGASGFGAASESTNEGSGVTFYRVEVSGTTIAANAYMQVVRRSADATQATTFQVDACFMDRNVTSTFRTWVSSLVIQNRNDPTNANPERINYIDVWRVPGDAPALVVHKIDTTSGTSRRIFVAGRGIDTKDFTAPAATHWIEDDDFLATDNSTGLGSGVNQNDANRSDGHYRRWTDGGSGGGADLRATYEGDAAKKILQHSRAVFAICRSSGTATKVGLIAGLGPVSAPVEFALSSPSNIQTANTWEMHMLGIIPARGLQIEYFDVGPTTIPRLSIYVDVDDVPSSGTFDLDAVLMVPIDDEYIVAKTHFNIDAGEQVWFDGEREAVISESFGANEAGVFGSMWNLEPGSVANRIVYAMTGNGLDHVLTNAANVTLTITPRTRHLLGTI